MEEERREDGVALTSCLGNDSGLLCSKFIALKILFTSSTPSEVAIKPDSQEVLSSDTFLCYANGEIPQRIILHISLEGHHL